MAKHSAPRRSPARSAWTAAAGTATSALVTLPVVLGAPAADAATDPASTIIQMTNAARAQKGCGALARNTNLDRAAQGYAGQMSRSGKFSHNGSDGSRFDQRIRAAGYPRPGGENLGTGQSSAREVMTDWMNSAGHRRNILDCSFKTIGVGTTRNGYWVQEFGR